MSARFIAVSLIVSVVWYGWQFEASGISVRNLVLHTAMWTFLGGALGKVIGLLVPKTPEAHAKEGGRFGSVGGKEV